MIVRFTKATWIVCGCLATIAMTAGVLPLVLARSSNSGGNSAALNNCKLILVYAKLSAGTNSFLPNASLMSVEERNQFFKLSENHWTGEAQYWVRTNGLNLASLTQIVVFCEQEFDNVPQPTFFNLYKRTPAYAVGFADGSTRLIAPPDFARLNKNDFAPLSALKQIYQP
jgi:hypothetical protein